jgi:hypothetical protein
VFGVFWVRPNIGFVGYLLYRCQSLIGVVSGRGISRLGRDNRLGHMSTFLMNTGLGGLSLHHCYVCGAPSEDSPWGEDGRSPLFEICPCCGCEHGYEDASIKGIEKLRAEWLATGGKWREPKYQPAGLTLEQQLSNIPQELPVGILKSS